MQLCFDVLWRTSTFFTTSKINMFATSCLQPQSESWAINVCLSSGEDALGGFMALVNITPPRVTFLSLTFHFCLSVGTEIYSVLWFFFPAESCCSLVKLPLEILVQMSRVSKLTFMILIEGFANLAVEFLNSKGVVSIRSL